MDNPIFQKDFRATHPSGDAVPHVAYISFLPLVSTAVSSEITGTWREPGPFIYFASPFSYF